MSWDKQNGTLASLVHEQAELASNFMRRGLNAYVYVHGRNPREAVISDSLTLAVEEQGPYLVALSATGNAPGTNKLTQRISLWANDDKILIENTIDKKANRNKEAVYFAFPFESHLKNASWDAGYGTTRFLEDQLAGANMDFISNRRWLDLSDNKKGVQLLMREALMVSPDSLVDERLYFNESYKKWRTKAAPTSLWFSYVMNNYWHTNFKADQSGVSSYNYALRPHAELRNIDQEKAAMAYTQPLVVIPIDKNTVIKVPTFELSNPNVVLTSITPDETGYVLRLFNPEETPQSVSISWDGHKVDLNLKGFAVYEWTVK